MHTRDNDGVKRITFSMSDELVSVIALEANRRRIPVSQFVRETLEAELFKRRTPPAFIGMFDDDRLTHGADVDRELERTWADHIRQDSVSDPLAHDVPGFSFFGIASSSPDDEPLDAEDYLKKHWADDIEKDSLS